MMSRVVLERCDSYSPGEVREAVTRALSLCLGGDVEHVDGTRILLKPNLTSARDPGRAVTTHPSVVGAAIDYFKERGARVSVGDSPAGATRGVKRVWEEKHNTWNRYCLFPSIKRFWDEREIWQLPLGY